MSVITRADLGELGIVFSRPGWNSQERVWVAVYPNGWTRRVVVDRDCRAIITRWIPPSVPE